MKTTYREATDGDRASWSQLRFELWPHCPIERHELEIAHLCSSPGLVVLAEVENEVVGFAEVSIRSDHVEGTNSAPVPYLEGWYVKPNFRGHGFGRGLLSYVEAWATSKGYTELASDAEVENELSILLHGRLDFYEVGRSVHFVKKLHSRVANGR